MYVNTAGMGEIISDRLVHSSMQADIADRVFRVVFGVGWEHTFAIHNKVTLMAQEPLGL